MRPVLRAALGHPHPERPRVTAALAARADVDGRAAASSAAACSTPSRAPCREVGGPPSHLLAALARADCFFVVPEEVTELPAGSPVEVWLLEG